MIWVCIDCRDVAEGIGEAPEAWTRLDPRFYDLGASTALCGHDLDVLDDDVAHEEGCETLQFSRWPCEACGSDLAGYRFAYTQR